MRFKYISIGILVVLGTMSLILTVLVFNLPAAVQWVIQYRYGSVLTSQQLQFNVYHVGKNRTLVSDLKWGTDVSAELAAVSYDFHGLGLPILRSLTLSGLTIQAVYDPGQGMVIDPVFPVEKMFLPSTSGTGPVSYLSFLPDRILVNNARLKLTMHQNTTVIPFNGSLSVNKSGQQVACDAAFYPFGQPVALKTRIHSVAGMETFHLKARAFDFQPLIGFLSMENKRGLPGTADWSLEKLTHNTWQVALSDMRMNEPDGLMIPHAVARILTEAHQITVLGELGVSHPVFSDLTASGRARVLLDTSGFGVRGMDLTCELQPMEKLVLQHNGATAMLKQPLAALSLQMKDHVIDGNLMVSFSQIGNQKQGWDISSGRGSFQSKIHADRDTGDLTFDLTSHLSKIQMHTPDGVVQFKRLDTAGIVSMNLFDELPVSPKVDLTTELVSGSIAVPEKKMAVQGIWAQLPVTYPHVGGTGRFSVEKLMIDNRTVLTGGGGIHHIGKQAVQFHGTFQVPDSDAVIIAVNGMAGMDPGFHLHVTAETNRFRFSPFRFENLLPRLPFLAEFDLDVQASGFAGWKNHRLSTGADLVIHEGSVAVPDQNLAVNGIQGRLTFDDLLAPTSVPGQILTVSRVQAGDFEATDAVVRFTLEPGLSLLLENMRINWAGGRVSTESIRIPSSDGSVALTLYCDRIQLDRLLAQLGGFDAQGNGSLNGRIPVVFKNGEVSFDNAFLFSTPGQGGRIVVQNPEKMVAGIPMDSPRFSHLDLAGEALKDFEYTWAKLTFNTQGDTLTANMELDGKPGRLLPFVYDKDINAFVRVDAQGPGSRFQGIKLDVNLTLPFNQVVTFGNKIRKLLK